MINYLVWGLFVGSTAYCIGRLDQIRKNRKQRELGNKYQKTLTQKIQNKTGEKFNVEKK